MSDFESKPCLSCRQPVSVSAIKCHHCGYILHRGLREHVSASNDRDSSKDGVAAVLTVFVPGLGHIYKGYLKSGLVWMFITWPLCFVFIGVAIWIWLIFRAYKLDINEE